MAVREIEISGRSLTIHERDDTHDPVTGRALTGSWLWDSALHLAQWMATSSSSSHPDHDLSGAAVLELGAGATGLPGLFAAAFLNARRVVLTDVAPLLPALCANVEANGLADRIEVRELRWGSEETSRDLVEGEEVDLVLMSDLWYDKEEMVGLGRTMRGVWGRRTKGWAASEVRDGVEDCVEVLRREGFEVVEVERTSRKLMRGASETAMFAVYHITSNVN
ncbi:uncharacterized protein [Typha latifolia]|uniref:uncharacterized protein n=1 Tax=Typha latifolia TaxID=4733 RepID=UPI003C2E31A2